MSRTRLYQRVTEGTGSPGENERRFLGALNDEMQDIYRRLAELNRWKNALSLGDTVTTNRSGVVPAAPGGGGRYYLGGSGTWVYRPAPTISFSVNTPDSITAHAERGTRSFCVMKNATDKKFAITRVTAIADTDNYESKLFESASGTDISVGNDVEICTMTCSDNGTEGYYTVVETFTNGIIDPGNWLIWEHSSGTADSLTVTIEGDYV